MNVLNKAWEAVRYLKPVRTFWQAAAALLGLNAVADALPRIESVDWVYIVSAAAVSGIVSFVSLMATGDSLWSSDRPSGPEA